MKWGGACGTYGKSRETYMENLNEGDGLDDLGVYMSVISESILFKIEGCGRDLCDSRHG
jgi:hypothetical protein